MRQGEQLGKPSSRPTQAVILAGGRGTRLRPLTDTRPKPMVRFGKPFLEYQVEQLRDQGFESILCCWDTCQKWFRTTLRRRQPLGDQNRVLGFCSGR